MVNNKEFYGEVVGGVKPYLTENISDFDQPIVSYQARTASSNPISPGQYQLIVPSSSNQITIKHSTGLLRTKDILIDGNITGATSISSTPFVGTLSGNATTVTNGVYLDETSTQTINGNVSVKQIDIDGSRCIYQQGTNGTDTRANLRVIANLSSDTNSQDGMLINYGSNGGVNANCKFYANGTTQRMTILAENAHVGIGTDAPTEKYSGW